MSRFPSGFFLFCVLLLLLAVFSPPLSGQAMVIPESEWDSFKANYMQLRAHSELLQVSLSNQLDISTELEKQLAQAWLDLSLGKTLLLTSEQKLNTAQRSLDSLGKTLNGSENSLKELNRSIRKQNGKSFLIGAGIGLSVGIITGVILGVYLGG